MSDLMKQLSVEELRRKQAMTLEEKISYSEGKIHEFVEAMGGEDKVFVSFSGGKDSTVMLHMIRKLYPGVKGVFCNTGLEYPEVLKFVKTVDNVVWLKPRKTVSQVWREYGVPCVSKEQSSYVECVRNSNSEKLVGKRLNYRGGYHLSKKWIFLTDKNFTSYESSDKCCKYFKKLPTEDYVKETKTYPFVGTMAGESLLRLNSWVRHSCNMYDGKKIQSRPLSVWTDEDIWAYIKKFDLEICELYHMGHPRTGCAFCPYGANLDKSEKNKFELLKEQHPTQYSALGKLGIRDVLKDMGVRIANDPEYMAEMQQRQQEIDEWFKMVEADIKEKGAESEHYKYHKYFTKKGE